MDVVTNRLMRHMAWANQTVYDAVQTLPDAALDSYVANPEWTARRILQHIVNGADWFSFCLTEKSWREIKLPQTMSDLTELKQLLAEFDATIASQVALPDVELLIKEDEKTWPALRSTVLAQAIYHATEHRAQLMDALEAKGYTPIALDVVSLWHFEAFEKSQ